MVPPIHRYRHISRSSWIVICVALLSLSARAQQASTSRPAVLDSALAVVLVPEYIETRNELLWLEYERDPRVTALAANSRVKLDTAFDIAYDAKTSYEAIAAAVLVDFDPATFEAFVRVLSAPMPRRLLALKLDVSHTPEGRAGFSRFWSRHEVHNLPPSRVETLEHLDLLTGYSRIMTEERAMVLGRMLGFDKGDSRFEQLVASILTQQREVTLAMHLYAYREVSDAELHAYVKLFEDPKIAVVDQIILRAFVRDEQHALQRLANELLQLGVSPQGKLRQPETQETPHGQNQ